MSGDDLYGLLGVETSATSDGIAEAGARRVRTADTSARDAYDILSDPVRRRGYDDVRRTRSAAAQAAESSQHHAAGGDDDVELELSFDQAALGTTATIHVALPDRCAGCEGAGALPGATCSECAGGGFNARTSAGINIRTECRSRQVPVATPRHDARAVKAPVS